MNQTPATSSATDDDLIRTQGITGQAIFAALSPLIRSPDALLFNGKQYDASMADHAYQLIQNPTLSALNTYADSPGTGGTTWVLQGGQTSLTKQEVRQAYQLSVVSLVITQGVSGKAIFNVLSKLISAPAVLTFDGKPYDDSLAAHDYAFLQIDGDTYGYVGSPDQKTFTWVNPDDEGNALTEQEAGYAASIDVQSFSAAAK